jgi:hypothetical protein
MLVRSRRWRCRNGRGCGSWNAKFGELRLKNEFLGKAAAFFAQDYR